MRLIGPGQSIRRRSITLRNWRILPSQGWDCRQTKASSVIGDLRQIKTEHHTVVEPRFAQGVGYDAVAHGEESALDYLHSVVFSHLRIYMLKIRGFGIGRDTFDNFIRKINKNSSNNYPLSDVFIYIITE